MLSLARSHSLQKPTHRALFPRLVELDGELGSPSTAHTMHDRFRRFSGEEIARLAQAGADIGGQPRCLLFGHKEPSANAHISASRHPRTNTGRPPEIATL